nr:MAG TPA: Mitochondrial genome maintenance exonuclease 1, DNA complex, DNA exonuclease [Caudoviricetes sp.]
MTNPKYSRAVPGKGRWYVHPATGERWPSVTNIIDRAVNKPVLVPWAAKVTAGKAWDVLPRMAAAVLTPDCDARNEDRCGKCVDCVNAELKAEVRAVKDTAAGLGSRIHAHAEALVLGKPVGHDPEVEPFVRQLIDCWQAMGINPDLDIEAAELTVVNRADGYAGTGDLLVWMTVGGERGLYVWDYKTSSTRPADSVYPEHGLQVAAIAHGETILLDDGTEVGMPGPIAGAFICSLRADDWALIPMPLAGSLEDAYTAFRGALTVANHLFAASEAKPTPISRAAKPERKTECPAS